MKTPQPRALEVELAKGVVALAPAFAFLPASRTLVAADAHLGYEDVIGGGGALPLWSTTEIATTLAIAAQRSDAREVVLLGDVIHGSLMSDGAAARVRDALDLVRAVCTLTLVAGNHEGRGRGAKILGPTVESCERDGWLLVHGDVAHLGRPAIIGHLHPSLPLGGASAPSFIASETLVVVPALTPYSPGLSVLSDACTDALARWNVRRRDAHVVAASAEALFPFGSLAALGGLLSRKPTARPGNPYRPKVLRADR